MPDYGKVDKIEFIYESTDTDGDNLHFTYVLGSNRIPIIYYDWEDEIPSFAVLYDKVSHHEGILYVLKKILPDALLSVLRILKTTSFPYMLI
ncbi:MAG: hypothetical protein Q4D07_06900 [Selenomonadaceae bacterium]|nr:hypothetical protein [Selenomonadaceae bacterium]